MESELYDIAIVGAGPAGLAGALEARRLAMRLVFLEQDDAGKVIDRTMREKRFSHRYGMNTDPLRGDLFFPDGALGSELVEGWRSQAHELGCLTQTRLLALEQFSQGWKLRTNRSVYSARAVLLATGMFAEPRKLDVAGEKENGRFLYEYDYGVPVSGERILVVGSGNSALEAAGELWERNNLTLLVHRELGALTSRNWSLFQRLEKQGVVLAGARIVDTAGGAGRVTIAHDGRLGMAQFDRIYVLIGYESPSTWLRSIGLVLGPDGTPERNEKLETNLKHIFVAGALAADDSIIGGAYQAMSGVHYIYAASHS